MRAFFGERVMKQYDIARIDGDGIGPEIIREGVKVLEAAAAVRGFRLNWIDYPFGADYYLKTGEALPESALAEMKQQSAIYFGAAGDPRVAPGVLEVGLILKMRFALDQYINLRPCKLYPNVETPLKRTGPIEIYCVRENLEDFYNGLGAIVRSNGDPARQAAIRMELDRALYHANFDMKASLGAADDYAVGLGIITRKNTERTMRYAFELARAKGKKKVTAVDKANVIPHMYGLWREVFEDVAKDYPGIVHENNFADACNMWFVKNPEAYDVVVFPNLMGDIVTDLGAIITGGLGFAAGGNINPEGVSMFEPIHGSAPKYKGLDVINPIATILAGGLMLETIGEKAAGELVERAVSEALASGQIRTRDMGGSTKCSEVGDIIAAKVRELGR